MGHIFQNLRNQCRGIAAVEFAFIAPVFIFMTTGAIDLGYIQWTRSQLAGATQVAGRQIIQSKSGTTAERKATFTSTITAAMASFPMPAGKTAVVAIRKYSNFSNLAPPEPFTDGTLDANGDGKPDGTKNGRYDLGEVYTDLNSNNKWDDDIGTSDDLGSIGDVVKVDVDYPVRPLFSYNAALFGNNGSLVISASTVFRNEPE